MNIEPDLQFSVLCDEVRREDNGKWMFLGLFENIAVPQFPTAHGALCVVNKWIGGQGQWVQQTRFIDEDDHVLLQSNLIPFELESLDASFMAIQAFAGLPLNGEGKIWIEVSLGGELKRRFPLVVNRG